MVPCRSPRSCLKLSRPTMDAEDDKTCVTPDTRSRTPARTHAPSHVVREDMGSGSRRSHRTMGWRDVLSRKLQTAPAPFLSLVARSLIAGHMPACRHTRQLQRASYHVCCPHAHYGVQRFLETSCIVPTEVAELIYNFYRGRRLNPNCTSSTVTTYCGSTPGPHEAVPRPPCL